MRIIKETTLSVFGAKHPQAASGLESWRRIIRREQFRHFADVRQFYSSADQVRVASGNPIIVFNICGNKYRLICAMHFNTGKVFLLRFLTHAEYDKDQWKDQL